MDSDLLSIPLERAYLCIDCNMVQDNAGHCNTCSSVAVHSLAKFINRTEDNSALLAIAHTCQDEPRFACAACDSTSVAIH
jgi:hypothetical protein